MNPPFNRQLNPPNNPSLLSNMATHQAPGITPAPPQPTLPAGGNTVSSSSGGIGSLPPPPSSLSGAPSSFNSGSQQFVSSFPHTNAPFQANAPIQGVNHSQAPFNPWGSLPSVPFSPLGGVPNAPFNSMGGAPSVPFNSMGGVPNAHALLPAMSSLPPMPVVPNALAMQQETERNFMNMLEDKVSHDHFLMIMQHNKDFYCCKLTPCIPLILCLFLINVEGTKRIL